MTRSALWSCGVFLAGVGSNAACGQILIPFDIDAGRVIPQVECAVHVTVLGAANHASACGGYGYERVTTLKLHVTDSIGNTVDYQPFGPFAAALDGNVNDPWDRPATQLSNPLSVTMFYMFDPDSEFTITAASWKRKNCSLNPNLNSTWQVFQTESSHLDNEDQMVVVLRDGDPVPDIDGFQDQASVEEYLEPYIDVDSGTVELGPNDAIYLFELGCPNCELDDDGNWPPAYDVQDLVVLVTMQNSPTPCFD